MVIFGIGFVSDRDFKIACQERHIALLQDLLLEADKLLKENGLRDKDKEPLGA